MSPNRLPNHPKYGLNKKRNKPIKNRINPTIIRVLAIFILKFTNKKIY